MDEDQTGVVLGHFSSVADEEVRCDQSLAVGELSVAALDPANHGAVPEPGIGAVGEAAADAADGQRVAAAELDGAPVVERETRRTRFPRAHSFEPWPRPGASQALAITAGSF